MFTDKKDFLNQECLGGMIVTNRNNQQNDSYYKKIVRILFCFCFVRFLFCFVFATLSSQKCDLVMLLKDSIHGNFMYFDIPFRHTYIPLKCYPPQSRTNTMSPLALTYD